MAFSYTEAEVAAQEMATRIQNATKRIEAAKSQVNQAESELASVMTAYSKIVSGVAAEVDSNPDEAIKSLHARMTRLLGECSSAKAIATAKKNAIK